MQIHSGNVMKKPPLLNNLDVHTDIMKKQRARPSLNRY